jgi:hypothetical protein
MTKKEILNFIESKITDFGETPCGRKIYVIEESDLEEIKEKLKTPELPTIEELKEQKHRDSHSVEYLWWD